MSTPQILIISGAFLAFGFFFLLFIVKRFKPQLSVKKSAKKIEKDNSLSFGKSKYYRLIFLIAFIPIFAQFFVDFTERIKPRGIIFLRNASEYHIYIFL